MTELATATLTPAQLRAEIRAGRFDGPTAGACPGYVQANVVILPAVFADDFEEFCRLNDRPCPLVARSKPGEPWLAEVAENADLRTDVPQYRVFHHGQPEPGTRRELVELWRDDMVAFLLGCSFTFERALADAGLELRHVRLGRNVSMYRTNIACLPAGPFAGPLVVSMRPFAPGQLDEVRRITCLYPRMHGGPIHAGDPAAIGIADLAAPDFGDPVPLAPGEIPVFWACGVTPQLALAAAKPDLAFTHAPGCMFVTDLTDSQFREPST